MGTRNLTCVVKDGEFRVAQYCQWDGYPSGQGANITKFVAEKLRTKKGLNKFKAQVDKIEIVDEAYISKLLSDLGIKGEWVTMEESERLKEAHPQFHRDFGAGILKYVYQADQPKVQLSVEFAGESLFCEWAYVIDLDNEVLEVYRGFNQEPVDESNRFAKFFNALTQEERARGLDQFYPVKLWRSFPLKKVTKGLGNKLDKEYQKELRGYVQNE